MSKRITVILLGILIGILAAEVLLRLTLGRDVTPNYWGLGAFEADPVLGFRHLPGFRGNAFRKDAFDSYVEISKLGFRQKDMQSQLSFPQKCLLLGDSFTFGLGVPEERAFPALIEPAMNAEKIGVLNGAQTGYCVDQETKLGHRLIAEFHPNAVVIFLFLDNDVEGDYLKDYQNIDVEYGYRMRKDRFLPFHIFNYPRTHLYTWLFLDTQFNNWRGNRIHFRFKTLARKTPQVAIAPTLQALGNFQLECRQANVRLAVVLIPFETREAKLFYPLLTQKLKSDQIPFLDLSTRGFTEADHFHLDHHWNEQGHKKASTFIAPFLLSLSGGGAQPE